MSWFRYLLLPALFCPPLLLTGALGRHADAPPVATAPAARVTPIADPVATEVLDQAIEMLNPQRVEWLEANVWQQVSCPDLTYQAHGRLRAGPGHRLRLNLALQVGQTRGEVDVVSDGTTLWQAQQVQGERRTVSHYKLQAYLDRLGQPPLPGQSELDHQLGFAGLAPLLQELRHRMVVTGQEVVHGKTGDVTRLTLVWPPESAAALAPANQPWPALLPRKCLLSLDAVTLWPHRLEWWAPAESSRLDQLIIAMEFRDPVMNRALTPAECAREFSFDPGPPAIADGSGNEAATSDDSSP